MLTDVTFDVAEGELVALVGPSGCGKTTLLRIMCGLLAPSEGTVLLDGRPVVRPSGKVALVFQDYSRSLFPWLTVLRNVTFPLGRDGLSRTERVARAEAALERGGSGGRREQVPVAALGRDAAAGCDRSGPRVPA